MNNRSITNVTKYTNCIHSITYLPQEDNICRADSFVSKKLFSVADLAPEGIYTDIVAFFVRHILTLGLRYSSALFLLHILTDLSLCSSAVFFGNILQNLLACGFRGNVANLVSDVFAVLSGDVLAHFLGHLSYLWCANLFFDRVAFIKHHQRADRFHLWCTLLFWNNNLHGFALCILNFSTFLPCNWSGDFDSDREWKISALLTSSFAANILFYRGINLPGYSVAVFHINNLAFLCWDVLCNISANLCRDIFAFLGRDGGWNLCWDFLTGL